MRSILNALQEGRLFELPNAGKARALEFLARILDANPDIEVGTDAIEEIQTREQACNTGIGLGVAVPHIRVRREEGDLFCAIGWSAEGLDYGAPDQKHVHLVFMYYIPGAQKNVYLKEVSTLVKAIKKTGGIEPLAHATDLNVVRNLLLDWVSEALGDTGPEAVARMIKLDVKQAQAPALPVAAAGLTLPVGATSTLRPGRAVVLEIIVAPGLATLVLGPDPDWTAVAEKDASLSQRLASGNPFLLAGRQVHVAEAAAFPGGRLRYQCILLPGPA